MDGTKAEARGVKKKDALHHHRGGLCQKGGSTTFLASLIENCVFCFRSTKCEYLDGSCLASPRWVSLLVAEIYYPDATFPNPANANPSQNRSPVQGVNPPNVSLKPHWPTDPVKQNASLSPSNNLYWNLDAVLLELFLSSPFSSNLSRELVKPPASSSHLSNLLYVLLKTFQLFHSKNLDSKITRRAHASNLNFYFRKIGHQNRM